MQDYSAVMVSGHVLKYYKLKTRWVQVKTRWVQVKDKVGTSKTQGGYKLNTRWVQVKHKVGTS